MSVSNRLARYNRDMRTVYVALVLSLAAPFFLRAAEVTLMEEIVAKINGDIITSAELRDDRKAFEDDLKKQKGITQAQIEQARAAFDSDALRDKIDGILMRQKGKDLNLKVDADVNKQIADYQRQFKLPDPEQFQKFVVDQTGRSYEDFRTQLVDNLLVEGVKREEIYRKVQVPPDEVRAYYDDHKDEFQRKERVFLRELLVSTAEKTSPEDLAAAETKAKDLSARAKRGESFAQMVQNNSDNDATKERGGLLDPFTKEALNPKIADAVWDQPAGFVTDPIRFDNGWEIFKVENHQREGLAAFDEVKDEIQNGLFSQRINPAIRAYLTKLRSEAFLMIKEGYFDSGSAPGKSTEWGDVLSLKPETITREEVIANPSMKRLLGLIPVPGTEKTGASSSR